MQQTSGADCATLANPHTGEDCHVASNPAILLNHNIPTQGRTVAPHAPPRINGISSTYELDIRAEDASRSDGDRAGIRDATISTNKYIVAHCDIITIVAVERCLYNDSLAHATKRQFHLRGLNFPVSSNWLRSWAQADDLAEEATALFGTGTMGWVGGVVEPPDSGNAALAVLGESRRQWQVVQSL